MTPDVFRAMVLKSIPERLHPLATPAVMTKLAARITPAMRKSDWLIRGQFVKACQESQQPPARRVIVSRTHGAIDRALSAAIHHLEEDATQPDLPKEERREDQALVGKLKAAQARPKRLVIILPKKPGHQAATGPRRADATA